MPQRAHHNAGDAHAKRRHMSYNEHGQLCMTVVDPATRKLLIPISHIYETRAQHRNTLPSLCQLFLANRCRQSSNCYQVHAAWDMVESLRAEVDALPCCCVHHGDPDRAGVLLGAVEYAEFMHIPPPLDVSSTELSTLSGESDPVRASKSGAARCLRDVVLYVPDCGEPYIALERVSYTVALKRLLEEQDPLRIASPGAGHTAEVRNPATGVLEKKTVVDATGCTVCRLHAMDRCRYAEECKFLHLCKDVTAANPGLTRCTAHGTAPTPALDSGSITGATGDAAPASVEEAGAAGERKGARSLAARAHKPHGGVSVFASTTRPSHQTFRAAGQAYYAVQAGPPSYPTVGDGLGLAPWTSAPPSYGLTNYTTTMGSAGGSLGTPAAAAMTPAATAATAAAAAPTTTTTAPTVGGPRVTLLVPQREHAATTAPLVEVAGSPMSAFPDAASDFFTPPGQAHRDSSATSSATSVVARDEPVVPRGPAQRVVGSAESWGAGSQGYTHSGAVRVLVNCSFDTSVAVGSPQAGSVNAASLSSSLTTARTSMGRTWQHNPYGCAKIMPMGSALSAPVGPVSGNICGSYEGPYTSQSLESRSLNQAASPSAKVEE